MSTRVYPLRSVDPQRLAELLSTTPEFNSTKKLKVDETNRAIIVSGSWRQHQLVVDLLRKFEPGKRRAESIQFRSVSVNQVVDMIQKAFGDKNYRLVRFGTNKDDSATPNGLSQKFQVNADVDQNLLQLWCTESEKREIHDFMVKLGVWKDESDGWIRIFDTGPDSQELVNRFLRLRLPVNTSIDASGRIVLCSQDLVKLDDAVSKFSDLTRDPNHDRDFQLKCVSAFWIRMNLENVFQSAMQEQTAAENELHLEMDDVPISNTLRVRGATPAQIQSIEWFVAANDLQI